MRERWHAHRLLYMGRVDRLLHVRRGRYRLGMRKVRHGHRRMGRRRDARLLRRRVRRRLIEARRRRGGGVL